MPRVFITYSWHDQSIVRDVVLPLLRENHVDYFVDYEYVGLGQQQENLLRRYVSIRSLERFVNLHEPSPWGAWPPIGKTAPELWPQLERQIASTNVHLVLMSQCACKSLWVSREIDTSIAMGKKIIVVNLDNSLMPDRLAALVHGGIVPHIDFSGPPDPTFIHSSWEDHVRDLYSRDKHARLKSHSDMNLTRGIEYRQATAEDKNALMRTLRSVHERPPFDPCVVKVSEEKFVVDNVPFEFLSLEGSPYFRRFCLAKYPVTNEQFALFIQDTGADIAAGDLC